MNELKKKLTATLTGSGAGAGAEADDYFEMKKKQTNIKQTLNKHQTNKHEHTSSFSFGFFNNFRKSSPSVLT